MLQHCLVIFQPSKVIQHAALKLIYRVKPSPYSRMLINGQKCIIIIQRFSELSPRMISVSVNL